LWPLILPLSPPFNPLKGAHDRLYFPLFLPFFPSYPAFQALIPFIPPFFPSHIGVALLSFSHTLLHQKSSHVLGDEVASATPQAQPYKSTPKVEFYVMLLFLSHLFLAFFFTFLFAFTLFSLISLCIHLLGSLLHPTALAP